MKQADGKNSGAGAAVLAQDADDLVRETDALLQSLSTPTSAHAARLSTSSAAKRPPSTKTKRSRNSTRDREKHEIAQLRQYVQDLERDLQALRMTGPSLTKDPHLQAVVASGWERLVARQLKNRQLAVSTNNRLRALVQENAWFIDRLSWMVYERRRVHEHLSHFKASANMSTTWHEQDVVNSLKHDAQVAYRQASAVFARNGLEKESIEALAKNPHRYEHEIRGDGSSSLVCQQSFPFCIEATASAAWVTVSMWCTQSDSSQRVLANVELPQGFMFGLFQHVEQSEDLCVTVSRTRVKFNGSEYPTSVHEVVCQFQEEDGRIVIIWRMKVCVDIGKELSRTSMLQMDTTGWISVSPVPGTTRVSIASAVFSARAACADQVVDEGCPAKPGSVVHGLLLSNEQCISRLMQNIEDELIRSA